MMILRLFLAIPIALLIITQSTAAGGANTTDSYRTIDVQRWALDGFLSPGKAYTWQLFWQSTTVRNIIARADRLKVVA
jgi:hypothetical protein